MSKRPLPPTVLVVTMIVLIAAHLLVPGPRILTPPATLVGLLPILAGVCLNLAADGLLKRHRTTVKPFVESESLVTTGVYGRTRNPMYVGFALVVLGLALLSGTLGPFVVVAVFPVLLDRMYVVHEETMLRDKFGEEWALYAGRVRKWL